MRSFRPTPARGGSFAAAAGSSNPGTAAHDITAMCLVDELDAPVEIASDRILTIVGVHHVETSIAVKTIKYNAKYNARMAKITRPAEVIDEE